MVFRGNYQQINGGLSEKPWANLAKPSMAVFQPTCYACYVAKLVNRGRLNGECFMDISAVGPSRRGPGKVVKKKLGAYNTEI